MLLQLTGSHNNCDLRRQASRFGIQTFIQPVLLLLPVVGGGVQ